MPTTLPAEPGKPRFKLNASKIFTALLPFVVGVGLGSILTYGYLSPYVGSNVDQQLIFKRKSANPAPPAAPAMTPQPPATSTTGWALVTDGKYKLQVKVPPAWSKTVKDTDSGFSLTMDTGNGGNGSVTISSDNTGHGTPGPQVSESQTTVAGQTTTKTTWEGGGTRLVQYKFTKDGLYYKFEMTAPTSASQVFSDFDTLVSTFKFTS